MATDFYERQEIARRNTSRLVLLFSFAVVFLVGSVAAITYYVIAEHSTRRFSAHVDESLHEVSPAVAAAAAGAVTLAAIIFGTLFKVVQLRHGGGSFLAERLDGVKVVPNARDVTSMRVLNVVEEMALASGTPVPPVYLLRGDATINAFAAGYSPSDAVIGVTSGCAERLTREQLQGVIAHEFSHILNGDMRLNIRLIGVLHGILLLALTGRWMLRGLMHGSDRKGNVVWAIVAIVLLVLGWVGYVIGGMIKAGVSRQREYLADASAVQFTRNPDGIAGALKRIAAIGSRLRSPHASEASHLFFAEGLAEGLTSLLATHPPLEKRIRALDPNWDGALPRASEIAGWAPAGAIASRPHEAAAFQPAPAISRDTADTPPKTRASSWNRGEVQWATDHVGDPLQQHREYAAALLASIDEELLVAVRDPFSSRAVVLLLLLGSDADLRRHQWQRLDAHADAELLEEMRRLAPRVGRVEPRTRLPLIDLSLPALRSLSAEQYRGFKVCLQDLIDADARLSLFEWVLGKVLERHLAPQFETVRNAGVRYYGLQRLGRPCSVLFSTLARVGHSASEAQEAFDHAVPALPKVSCEFLPPSACTLDEVERALTTLATVVAPLRGKIIDAAARCIAADGRVTLREGELLRGIADMLDCPMPPLLPGQKLRQRSSGFGEP